MEFQGLTPYEIPGNNEKEFTYLFQSDCFRVGDEQIKITVINSRAFIEIAQRRTGSLAYVNGLHRSIQIANQIFEGITGNINWAI